MCRTLVPSTKIKPEQKPRLYLKIRFRLEADLTTQSSGRSQNSAAHHNKSARLRNGAIQRECFAACTAIAEVGSAHCEVAGGRSAIHIPRVELGVAAVIGIAQAKPVGLAGSEVAGKAVDVDVVHVVAKSAVIVEGVLGNGSDAGGDIATECGGAKPPGHRRRL